MPGFEIEVVIVLLSNMARLRVLTARRLQR